MSSYSETVFIYMKAAQEDLFKKHPEQIKKYEAACIQYEWKDSPLTITVSDDRKYNGKYAITFSVGNSYFHLVKFTLDLYPACCALNQLNDFHTDEVILLEPFLKDFIQLCINTYRRCVSTPRRLMINFVEWTRQNDYNPSQKDIPVSDKTQINFPMMYKWAKESDHIETTFVNHNTGRIIHNVIVNLE